MKIAFSWQQERWCQYVEAILKEGSRNAFSSVHFISLAFCLFLWKMPHGCQVEGTELETVICLLFLIVYKRCSIFIS